MPGDPDKECSAGGCPSEAISPRPEGRPGHQRPRADTVLAGGWIWDANLRRFLELVSFYVSYSFDESDWLAIQAGLDGLTAENDTFEYPIIGRPDLNVTLSKNPNGHEISITLTGRPDRLLGARISGLIDAYQYR